MLPPHLKSVATLLTDSFIECNIQ